MYAISIYTILHNCMDYFFHSPNVCSAKTCHETHPKLIYLQTQFHNARLFRGDLLVFSCTRHKSFKNFLHAPGMRMWSSGYFKFWQLNISKPHEIPQGQFLPENFQLSRYTENTEKVNLKNRNHSYQNINIEIRIIEAEIWIKATLSGKCWRCCGWKSSSCLLTAG